MSKNLNHVIPDFIMRYFRVSNTKGQVYLLNKSEKTVKPINTRSWSSFNLKKFYSKKDLRTILQKFPSVKVNPLFTRLDDTLENNLDYCLEDPFKKLLEKIISGAEIGKFEVTESEANFIKEYVMVQKIRTYKFREDAKFLSKDLKVISIGEISKRITEEAKKHVLTRNPNPREILKKATESRLRMLRYYDNPENHTLEIVNNEKRTAFFNATNLQAKRISLLVNKTAIPFILPDSGIVELSPTERFNPVTVEVYLPISPKYCLKISSGKNDVVEVSNQQIINSLNSHFLEMSLSAVVSGDKEYLARFSD